MFLWQKCTIIVLVVVIFGSAAYVARIVFRPEGLARYKSIPWVNYVHPNVKKLKQAQALVDEGKLSEARKLLVNALITAPKSPVTRDLRDLLGDVNTQIFLQTTVTTQNRIHGEERRRTVVDRAKASIERRGDHSRE